MKHITPRMVSALESWFSTPGRSVLRVVARRVLALGQFENLPTAHADFRGGITFLPGAAGAVDRFVRCEKDAGDVYVWQREFAGVVDATPDSEADPDTNTAGYAEIYNIGGADPNAFHGAVWPEEARMGFTVARHFDSGGGENGPTVALTAHIESDVATSSGVALMCTGEVQADNGAVFGQNIVVTTAAGTTGGKMVGLEIDVQPNVGTSPSSASGGLFLNAFNVDMTNAPAIFLNGSGGGKWGFGIVLNGISQNGVGLTVQASAAEMEWGIHLNNGTYGTAAAQFGAQNDKPALILNEGVAGTTSDILAVQNAAGSHTYASINGSTLNMISASSGIAEVQVRDTTDGGWTMFASDGELHFATVDTAGAFVTDRLVLGAAGGIAVVTPATLTIASGVITLPAITNATAAIFAVVDTEAAAASDDLTTIAITGTVPSGTMLYLRSANAARDVVVKHDAAAGTNSPVMTGAADATLGLTRHVVALVRSGTFWAEVARNV